MILTGLLGNGSAAFTGKARDKNAATAAKIPKHLRSLVEIRVMVSPIKFSSYLSNINSSHKY
jgi:hypothetical protein